MATYTLIISGSVTATCEVEAVSVEAAQAYFAAYLDPSTLVTPDRLDVDVASFEPEYLIDIDHTNDR